MQFLLSLIFLVLCGFAFLAVKFIQDENKDQKKQHQEKDKIVGDLEEKLKRTQEEFAKEKSEKEKVEALLYQTKDESDSIKNQNNELKSRIDELNKINNENNILKKENEELRNELKSVKEIQEGLKSQYDELSKHLEQINQQRIIDAAENNNNPPSSQGLSEDKPK